MAVSIDSVYTTARPLYGFSLLVKFSFPLEDSRTIGTTCLTKRVGTVLCKLLYDDAIMQTSHITEIIYMYSHYSFGLQEAILHEDKSAEMHAS